jgi:hypothetical protein
LSGGVWRWASPLRSFCTSPENFCTSPEKSYAPPLVEVSMIDESENLTFFGCLGSTLFKKVFL